MDRGHEAPSENGGGVVTGKAEPCSVKAGTGFCVTPGARTVATAPAPVAPAPAAAPAPVAAPAPAAAPAKVAPATAANDADTADDTEDDQGFVVPSKAKAALKIAKPAATETATPAAFQASAAPAAPAAPIIKGAPPTPHFSRAPSVASGAAAPTPDETAPWTLDLSANLKRAAWNGNALFIFFDLEDPQSLETKTYTALYQTPVKAGAKLGAQMTLQPSEGFRAGHTYRLRVVQLIGGKEVLLTEGDLGLL